MATLTIRGLSDETLQALTQQAANANTNRESWVRELLDQFAQLPVVRESYELRFYQKDILHETVGRLVRDANGDTRDSNVVNPTLAQLEAYRKARDLVRRNLPGDREKAIAYLSREFDTVFEAPAAPTKVRDMDLLDETEQGVKTHSLGIRMSDSDVEVLFRTDDQVWWHSLPAGEWQQLEAPPELVAACLGPLKRQLEMLQQSQKQIEQLSEENAMLRGKLEEQSS